jgi:peptidoglycan/xylan/chitin deacetylase (PgdA/CDA1 family)
MMVYKNYLFESNNIYKKSIHLEYATDLEKKDKIHLNAYSRYALSSLNPLLIFFFCLIALVTFSYSQYFVEATSSIDNINQSALNSVNKSKIGNIPASCNCVIFRMDDIQDYWLNSVQNKVMDVFLNHNQTLSLGLIMHMVGNDSKIVEKVKEGLHKGLFELDIHGWNHVDYTKLSEREQKDSLSKANEKMQKVFGRNSSIFITPLSVFNNKTLNAMADLKINILSSDIPTETKFDQNKSIFIAQDKSHDKLSNRLQIINNTKIYHIPATVFFKDFQKGQWVKTPIDEILKDITKNIAKYGYAVIVLHPQDFALFTGKSGASVVTYINSIDRNEILDLSKILDYLLSNNIKIKGFGDIIK